MMMLTLALANRTLAFDRSSRSYDQDGRLHVEMTNISKANVCPYLGHEIPDWKNLGLDANKIYQMYRHPEELARGVSTFNKIQLLDRHVAVSADDHKPHAVVGSTGTDAVFEAPYLRNSLVIWAKDAIDRVEDKSRCELSCAYYYDPDMTPGEVDGVSYDGVMRNIRGNHVALVEDGRAGADVVVGDSATTQQIEERMLKNAGKRLSPTALIAQGALMTFVQPKLATDAKLDYRSILLGTTAKNWSTAKTIVSKRLGGGRTIKRGGDATLEGIEKFLDSLAFDNSDDPPDAEDEDPDAEDEDPDATDEDPDAEDEDPDAEDEDPDATDETGPAMKPPGAKDKKTAKDRRLARDKRIKKITKDRGDMVTRQAMDQAIAASVNAVQKQMRQSQLALREAERLVRPYIGDLELAQDSAEAVYRVALETIGVDVTDLPPVAYKPLLLKLPKPSLKLASDSRVAMDAKQNETFLQRYPDANRLRRG